MKYIKIKLEEYRELLVAYGQLQMLLALQQEEESIQENIQEENTIGYDTKIKKR